MSKHPMVIDGKLVQAEGSATSPVINPATGKDFDTVPAASAADVNKGVAAAKKAFGSWRTKPFAERALCFEKFAELLEARKEQVATALSQEQGKPIMFAHGEVSMLIAKARTCAKPEVELVPEDYESSEKGKCVQIFEPRGVVVGICPWNFPIMIGGNKMMSPACGGNTVVVKPSPYTPLATVMLSELVAEAFPPGVINIITGDNSVGQLLVEHPDVTTITFTGSNATGKKIMSSASNSLKKVVLELGGNDPAIVMPDSNVEDLAPKLFQKAMFNTGQVCIAVKRLFVHSSQYEDMVKKLAEEATKKRAVLGNGLNETTEYGPLNNQMQRDRIEELVNDARSQGARIVAGGERANPEDAPDAFFYAPTIIADVSDSTRIVREEQFGPALPVLKYDSVDEAVSRANDTQYGLGASVWGSDLKEAAAVASKLQSGTIWINTHIGSGLNIDAPFGGIKESGIGKEGGGKNNFLKPYCDEKYLYVPSA